MLRLSRQLDGAAAVCMKVGTDQTVLFRAPDPDAVIVLSPPYARISGGQFSHGVAEQMQEVAGSQETGHLFYIKNEMIADHRLLTGLAEPVYGMGKGDQVHFLVSRKATSGRPIRIEIIPNTLGT